LKKILLACLLFILGSVVLHAQQKNADPCADIKEMYDIALYHLDSTIGDNIKLQKQLNNLQHNTAKSKTEGKTLSETKSELEAMKKLNAQQAEEIKRLKSEVKRLSTKTSG